VKTEGSEPKIVWSGAVSERGKKKRWSRSGRRRQPASRGSRGAGTSGERAESPNQTRGAHGPFQPNISST